MLTEKGYATYANEPAVRDVLDELDGLLQASADSNSVAILKSMLLQSIRTGEDAAHEISDPTDVLLLVNRGLELCPQVFGEAEIHPILSIADALESIVQPSELGVSFTILHARYCLGFESPESAYNLAHRSIPRAENENLKLQLACAMLIASRALLSMGYLEESWGYINEAELQLTTVARKDLLIDVLLQQAALHCWEGQNSKALQLIYDMRSLNTDALENSVVVKLTALESVAKWNREDPLAYVELLKDAISEMVLWHDPATFLLVLDNIAEAYITVEDYENSGIYSKKVIDRAPMIQQKSLYARSLHRLGRIALYEARLYEAIGKLNLAHRVSTAANFMLIAARSQIVLGRAQIKLMLKLVESGEDENQLRNLIREGFENILEGTRLAGENMLKLIQAKGEIRLFECLLYFGIVSPKLFETMSGELQAMIRREYPVVNNIDLSSAQTLATQADQLAKQRLEELEQVDATELKEQVVRDLIAAKQAGGVQ